MSTEEPVRPVPSLCFAHGGSKACEDDNKRYGLKCPKCYRQVIEDGVVFERYIGHDGLTFPQSFDARTWAEEFVHTVKYLPHIAHDKETMIGWFANAIMCGCDRITKNNNDLDRGARILEEQYNICRKLDTDYIRLHQSREDGEFFVEWISGKNKYYYRAPSIVELLQQIGRKHPREKDEGAL